MGFDHVTTKRSRTEPGPDRAQNAYEKARRAFELGSRVRTLREERGLSQTQLAKRVGMTQASMARFESGGTVLTLPLLERLAEALEMRLSIALTHTW
jgi:ribosome-binding protein aMBF1 (putative translation factor)